ncbi:hypothetical protein [Halorarum salinum]|uniref:Uncharacterized protein n=1 Tax=Halorarum salinum TaxID=2743089 RepID=A0A7D5QAW4_9EURY|nr:hypothetical protein [Halobaculum salinum]QLG60581.1 hypothetical protein HUG12_02000 [Halobaculum salinum]
MSDASAVSVTWGPSVGSRKPTAASTSRCPPKWWAYSRATRSIRSPPSVYGPVVALVWMARPS